MLADFSENTIYRSRWNLIRWWIRREHIFFYKCLCLKEKDFTRQPSFDKRQYLVEFRLWGRVTKVKSNRSSGDLIEIETNPATAKCMIGQTHISRGLPIFCLTLSAATPNEFMMGYTTETRGKKYLSAILEVPWFRHSMRIYYWAQCNNFQNFVFSWDEISALSWFCGWHQEKGTIWDQARSMKWMHENNHLYWFLERLSHSQIAVSKSNYLARRDSHRTCRSSCIWMSQRNMAPKRTLLQTVSPPILTTNGLIKPSLSSCFRKYPKLLSWSFQIVGWSIRL